HHVSRCMRTRPVSLKTVRLGHRRKLYSRSVETPERAQALKEQSPPRARFVQPDHWCCYKNRLLFPGQFQSKPRGPSVGQTTTSANDKSNRALARRVM